MSGSVNSGTLTLGFTDLITDFAKGCGEAGVGGITGALNTVATVFYRGLVRGTGAAVGELCYSVPNLAGKMAWHISKKAGTFATRSADLYFTSEDKISNDSPIYSFLSSKCSDLVESVQEIDRQAIRYLKDYGIIAGSKTPAGKLLSVFDFETGKEMLKDTGKTDANGNPVMEKVTEAFEDTFSISELVLPSLLLWYSSKVTANNALEALSNLKKLVTLQWETKKVQGIVEGDIATAVGFSWEKHNFLPLTGRIFKNALVSTLGFVVARSTCHGIHLHLEDHGVSEQNQLIAAGVMAAAVALPILSKLRLPSFLKAQKSKEVVVGAEPVQPDPVKDAKPLKSS